MKVVNSLLTAIFILFAYFQLNDPDPMVWVTWYAFLALLAGFAIFKKFWVPSILAALAINVGWMAFLFPEFLKWWQVGMPSITSSMKAETPFVEFVREFLGLLVCLLVLVGLYVQARQLKWKK
ncbi:MAG: hypothetical protein HC892_05375 [Saprospiraceae bacterium]|nr:hypothetical protein [Saprospiraceae bacterium]